MHDSGGDADLGQLLREHDPMMRAVAYRIVGAGALDDVMQDAYLRAVKGYSTFEHRSSFRTWLYRIVHNTAVDHVRSSQRRITTSLDQLDDDLATADDTPLVALEQAVATLPLDQRIALTLVSIIGLDYRDAAQMLDIPIGTVASRVHRARQALQSTLQDSDPR